MPEPSSAPGDGYLPISVAPLLRQETDHQPPPTLSRVAQHAQNTMLVRNPKSQAVAWAADPPGCTMH